MIAPRVDSHVGRGRHVTVHTSRTRGARFVMMMAFGIVFTCRVLVARRANLVALMNQFRRVRIVAVAAADAVVKHFALQERTVHIVLFTDLTVRVVDGNVQQLQRKVIIKITARHKPFLHDGPARVTRSTRLYLSQIRRSF